MDGLSESELEWLQSGVVDHQQPQMQVVPPAHPRDQSDDLNRMDGRLHEAFVELAMHRMWLANIPRITAEMISSLTPLLCEMETHHIGGVVPGHYWYQCENNEGSSMANCWYHFENEHREVFNSKWASLMQILKGACRRAEHTQHVLAENIRRFSLL